MAREQLRLMECKICRDTPTPPVVVVTCCKQLLGCEACYQSCVQRSNCCPLCRDSDVDTIAVEGLSDVYTFLAQAVDVTSD